MGEKSGQREIAIQHVDRPDLAETFIDAIDGVFFDGQTLRIECGVTRLKNDNSAQRYPVCRLVLTPTAAVALINQMQQVAAALIKVGVLKQNGTPSGRSQAQ